MLDRIGQRYGVRPSSILGITDDWAAFQLDAATLRLGLEIDAAVARESAPPGKRPPGPRVADVIGLSGMHSGKRGGRTFKPLLGSKLTRGATVTPKETVVWHPDGTWDVVDDEKTKA